jgi:hypothetical protein
MRFIAVRGDRAYIFNSSCLTVADISNADEPGMLGWVGLPTYGRGLALAGDLAYVADYTSGLVIVDVADPSLPYIAGSVTGPRRAYGVAVRGNYAYVASREASSRRGVLYTFDVTDPARPLLVDSCGVWRYGYDVALLDTFLYVACGTRGCRVVSVADPAHPQPIDSFGTKDYRKLWVSGHYLYAACHERGLQIFDLDQPGKPVLAAQYDTPGSALDLFVDDRYVYVADGDGGAVVLGRQSVGAAGGTVSRASLHLLQNPSGRAGLAGVLELAEAADVTLGIYSVAGRLVRSEHLGPSGPGSHPFTLGLAGLPAGTYFLRASGAGDLQAVKFVRAR